MNVQVVYCNHHTASVSVRERLAFSNAEQLGAAYRVLRDRYPDAESVLLSTCNRVELYVAQQSERNVLTHNDFVKFLSDFHGIATDEFIGDLLQQEGADAVRHLFRVVSSIDSMVLGEPQIVSQVKNAYRIASENDACGPVTNVWFQRAIAVSSRVRRETKLAEGRVSVASVAVGEFARSIFDRFDDKLVLVIGAGEMASETLDYLNGEGVKQIVVVNRGRERSRALANQFGGETGTWEELDDWMRRADVIVSATGAARPIVDVDRFRRVRAGRTDQPVFILDLGAPRAFDPAVGSLDDNVFLYDIDDLEATCERNRRARQAEVRRAEQIVDEETDRFMHDIHHRATGPIIQRLREEWHAISRQETEQLFRKLPELDEQSRQAVERSVARIVNKLLHPPLETLRDEARTGAPHGLLDAMKRLFRIGE